jgi:uncharacterized protein YlxP (DUF503 family)
MLIALLQFELLIRGAESIKDKRRVVKSVKDRLHREHLVSVAEVAHLDNMNIAGMGLALVGRDGRYMQGVMDTIIAKLRALDGAELGEVYRELLNGDQLPTSEADEHGVPLWSEAELREAEQAARANDSTDT